MFDADGNGVLDVNEVISLTSAMYSSFGLQVPSEGSVRAFFVAMDENGDGVLSEREFRRFFEMFLRFAFFDVAKLRQIVEQGNEKVATMPDGLAPPRPTAVPIRAPAHMPEPLESIENLQPDPRRIQPPTPVKPSDTVSQPRPRRSPQATDGRRRHRDLEDGSKTPKEKSHRQRSTRENPTSCLSGGSLRCVASSGVAYRNSANYKDRSDWVCHQGDAVQVLEHWVRTESGWLPLTDSSGRALFQVEDAVGRDRKVRIDDDGNRRRSERPADVLGEGEEEWQERWNRLSERFPNVPREKVLQALRDNQGHAGIVANMLRDM